EMCSAQGHRLTAQLDQAEEVEDAFADDCFALSGKRSIAQQRARVWQRQILWLELVDGPGAEPDGVSVPLLRHDHPASQQFTRAHAVRTPRPAGEEPESVGVFGAAATSQVAIEADAVGIPDAAAVDGCVGEAASADIRQRSFVLPRALLVDGRRRVHK